MIVYIAGPMSGIEDFNFPAFNEAAETLRELTEPHWLVINPAENFGGQQDLPWQVYLRRAIRQVSDADVVVLLPGWSRSRGARLERRVAKGLGLSIVRWRDLAEEEPDGE